MGRGDISGEDMLCGAIFMCNRKTKKECLQRMLFGLPTEHGVIVRAIMPGMILFLFEYEERKLYGVFQATTEGAMDIVPNAFRSSGRSFSAQIRFRSIWNCYPLKEDEFRAAIRDNYYDRKKFFLGLVQNQVQDLLKLFDSKKVVAIQNGADPVSLSCMDCGFDNSAFAGSSSARLGKFTNLPQQPVHSEFPCPPRMDALSYAKPLLDDDNHFARGELHSSSTVGRADDFPSHYAQYSEDSTYFSFPRDVALSSHHSLLQESALFHTDPGFYQEEPSCVRMGIPLDGINDLPRHNSSRVQIDVGKTASSISVPFSKSCDLEYHGNITFCSEELNPLRHLSSIGSAREYTGMTPASITSGPFHQYSSDFLQLGDCRAQFLFDSSSPVCLPESNSIIDSSIHDLAQENDFMHAQCPYSSKSDNSYDVADGLDFKADNSSLINEKTIGQTKRSVFARLSNTQDVREQELAEEATLADLQTWLSKQSRFWRNSQLKLSRMQMSRYAPGEKRSWSWRRSPDREKKIRNIAVEKQTCISSQKRQKCTTLGENQKIGDTILQSVSKCISTAIPEQKSCHVPIQKQEICTVQPEHARYCSVKTEGIACNGGASKLFTTDEFINFKRRSDTHRYGKGVDATTTADSGGPVPSLEKSKRRKLVRPSFSTVFVNDESSCQSGNSIQPEGIAEVECGPVLMKNCSDSSEVVKLSSGESPKPDIAVEDTLSTNIRSSSSLECPDQDCTNNRVAEPHAVDHISENINGEEGVLHSMLGGSLEAEVGCGTVRIGNCADFCEVVRLASGERQKHEIVKANLSIDNQGNISPKCPDQDCTHNCIAEPHAVDHMSGNFVDKDGILHSMIGDSFGAEFRSGIVRMGNFTDFSEAVKYSSGGYQIPGIVFKANSSIAVGSSSSSKYTNHDNTSSNFAKHVVDHLGGNVVGRKGARFELGCKFVPMGNYTDSSEYLNTSSGGSQKIDVIDIGKVNSSIDVGSSSSSKRTNQDDTKSSISEPHPVDLTSDNSIGQEGIQIELGRKTVQFEAVKKFFGGSQKLDVTDIGKSNLSIEVGSSSSQTFTDKNDTNNGIAEPHALYPTTEDSVGQEGIRYTVPGSCLSAERGCDVLMGNCTYSSQAEKHISGGCQKPYIVIDANADIGCGSISSPKCIEQHYTNYNRTVGHMMPGFDVMHSGVAQLENTASTSMLSVSDYRSEQVKSEEAAFNHRTAVVTHELSLLLAKYVTGENQIVPVAVRCPQTREHCSSIGIFCQQGECPVQGEMFSADGTLKQFIERSHQDSAPLGITGGMAETHGDNKQGSASFVDATEKL